MSESFSLNIQSAHKPYAVYIGLGLAEHILNDTSKLLLVDSRLKSLYPALKRDSAIYIDTYEENKTFGTVAELIKLLRDSGAQRNTHLVAVGGGIVQDLATFVASSYMRGIVWTYCPTTLLGMVDSCIGGKSPLNVGKYKNIAGNFYPPESIIVDPVFCATLPKTQRIEGLCEAIKICFASTGAAFDSYLDLARSSDLINDQTAQEKLISISLETKKIFIEEDEFDNGVRLLLNFGHTFGHAIEAASGFQVSHGIAVGLGMLAALSFSKEQGFMLNPNERVHSLVQQLYSLLSGVPNLVSIIQDISPNMAAEKFRSDKKHRDGCFVVIAINNEGHLERRFVPATEKNSASVLRAFESLKFLPL